jgi:hypothetical protein
VLLDRPFGKIFGDCVFQRVGHVTKSRGIGRGGARPGGGRPKGSRNKRTTLLEILPKLDAQDRQLPLYRLLDRIADESLDARYRDVLCVQVLPFLHSRLSPNLSAKPPFLMTDAELDETMKCGGSGFLDSGIS